MSNADVKIAETILKQMGGANRIKAMTGAKMLIAIKQGVAFTFPQRSPRKSNHVRITLNADDVYIMTFGRVTRRGFEVIEEFSEVYAEDLKTLFEGTTGLRLSL